MRSHSRVVLMLSVCTLLLPATLSAQVDITTLRGGDIAAQYDDSPGGEEIEKVIDGDPTSKYLTFNASAWIQYSAPRPFVVNRYAITSANDYPQRDPRSWTLQGSHDGNAWAVLDTRTEEAFPNRYQKREFQFNNRTPYTHYRLQMRAVSGTTLQLAEWELWTEIPEREASVTRVLVRVADPSIPAVPRVTVRNGGALAATFPVYLRIAAPGGGPAYERNVEVRGLAPGEHREVDFPAWQPGRDVVHRVVAWSALRNDAVPENDTLWTDANANKRVYIVPYTHLDLQWGWTLERTIEQYLPSTLRDNFALLEQYPDYQFSFEGAYRYMLIKEHYPREYERLKEYISQGRWHVAGSMLEGVDVNLPSPEALIRQILYGNRFFEQEFGRRSLDILLPDCFGFPYTLPTIAAHCGLMGFSTQKFDLWGGFRPSPFSIGRWEGVDGSSVIAVLKPGPYSSTWQIRERDLNQLGESAGLYLAYDYFGRGDTGGAPNAAQVATLMERVERNPTEEIELVVAASDRIFRDLTDEQISRLPVYRGELLMTRHATGVYTSRADQKRLNRLNERAADEAERAAVAAEWAAGRPYPAGTIYDNWVRFLPYDFHDDLTGTSINAAYDRFSTPNRTAARQAHLEVRDRANREVAAMLDTRVPTGTRRVSVVVYNPIGFPRYDIAEAVVRFAGTGPEGVRVYDGQGREVPAQVVARSGDDLTIAFMAEVPAVGYAVFQVEQGTPAGGIAAGLRVSPDLLENERYRARIDANGDLASLYDKKTGRELLAESSRWSVQANHSSTWPAWEILFRDIMAPPRSHVDGHVQKRVIESGPARITVRVSRSNEGSTFTHDYSLTADPDGFLRVDNVVDWHAEHPDGSLLKAVFPLTPSPERATYDLGVGVIERGVNHPELYEVPAQQWVALSDAGGGYGVAILSDTKHGWDRPAEHLLRLTLIHTPNGTRWYFADGDRFEHTFAYALYGYAGGWAEGGVVAAGQRMNQPLAAFQTASRPGPLGTSFSLVAPGGAGVALMAVKKAESGSGYIIRVRETHGRSWPQASLVLAGGIAGASEVNGMEDPIGDVLHSQNTLTFAIGPFELKTFRVQLQPPGR